MENTQSKMLPTDADFDKAELKTSALKWAELTEGKYIIEGRRELTTSYGDAMILTLSPYDDGDVCGNMNETVEVWACNRLMQKLKHQPDTKCIRNNGLRISQKNKGHEYYSFDLWE